MNMILKKIGANAKIAFQNKINNKKKKSSTKSLHQTYFKKPK